jgi:spore coat polysaccharide biosynthesis protein SpsF
MITAIVQARMSSKRLPGKVLLPLGGVTVLEHTLARVAKATRIRRIVVATSDRDDDDAIDEVCNSAGVPVFRGSLDDVLDRYYRTASAYGAEHVCRITADCPLIDPQIIDRVAAAYEERGCDYISTGRIRSTFPDGMDTEIFSASTLATAWNEARLPSEREHVTSYIWSRPERFSVETMSHHVDLSDFRLTLDDPEDYLVLTKVVAHAGNLTMEGIVEYLRNHREIAALNASLVRDSGYWESVKADRRDAKNN